MWSQLSSARPPSSSDNDRRRFPPPPVPPTGSGSTRPMPPPQQQVHRPPAPGQRGFPLPPVPNVGPGIQPSASSDHESYADDDDYSDDGALGATINLVTSAASRFFKATVPPQQQVGAPPPPVNQFTPVPSKAPSAQNGAESFVEVSLDGHVPNAVVPPAPPVHTMAAAAVFGSISGPGISAARSGFSGAPTRQEMASEVDAPKPPTQMFRPPSQPPNQAVSIQASHSFGSVNSARLTPMASPRPSPVAGLEHPTATKSPGGRRATFPPPTPPPQYQRQLTDNDGRAQFGNVTPSATNRGSGPTPVLPTTPAMPVQPNLGTQKVQQSRLSPRPTLPPPNTPVANSMGSQVAFGNRLSAPTRDDQSVLGQPLPSQKSRVDNGKPPPTPTPTPAQQAHTIFAVPSTTASSISENGAMIQNAPPTVPSLQAHDNGKGIFPSGPPSGTSRLKVTHPASPRNVQSSQDTSSRILSMASDGLSSPSTPLITNQQQKMIPASLPHATSVDNPTPSLKDDNRLQQPDISGEPEPLGTGELTPPSNAIPNRRRLRAPPQIPKTLMSASTAAKDGNGPAVAAKLSRPKFRLPTPRKRVPPALLTKQKKEVEKESKSPDGQENAKNDATSIMRTGPDVRREAAEAVMRYGTSSGGLEAPSSSLGTYQRSSVSPREETQESTAVQESASPPIEETSHGNLHPETQMAPATAAISMSADSSPKAEFPLPDDKPEESVPVAEELSDHGYPTLMPEGWAEAADPSSGQVYFFNATTGETSWEKPSWTPRTEIPAPVYAENDIPLDEAEVLDSPKQNKDIVVLQTVGDMINASSANAGDHPVESYDALDATPETVLLIEEHEKKCDGEADNPDDVAADDKEVEEDLPDGWIEAYDPSSARSYYYHSESGQVSWDRPNTSSIPQSAVDEPQEEVSDSHESPKASNDNAFDSNPEVAAVEDLVDQFGDGSSNEDCEEPLPDGWVELVDPSTLQHYFYSSLTGETRWDRPSSNSISESKDIGGIENPSNEVSGALFQAEPESADPISLIGHDTAKNLGGEAIRQVGNSNSDWSEDRNSEIGEVLYHQNDQTAEVAWTLPSSEPDNGYSPVAGASEHSPSGRKRDGSALQITKGSGLPARWAESTNENSGDPFTSNQDSQGSRHQRSDMVSAADAVPIVCDTQGFNDMTDEVALDRGDGEDETVHEKNQVEANNRESPLPDGWTEATEPNSGSLYYHNTETGETSWDKPIIRHDSRDKIDGIELIPPVGLVGEDDVGRLNEHSIPNNGEELVDDAFVDQSLPSGWESFVDPGNGETYYVHIESGRSSWQHPTSIEGEDNLGLNDKLCDDALANEHKPDTGMNGVESENMIAAHLPDDTPNDVYVVEMKLLAHTPEVTDEVEPLPDGWVEAFDPNGTPYYYHSLSGNVSWERPLEQSSNNSVSDDRKVVVDDNDDAIFESYHANDSTINVDYDAMSNSEPEQKEPIGGEGRSEVADPDSGRSYLVNGITGETACKLPVRNVDATNVEKQSSGDTPASEVPELSVGEEVDQPLIVPPDEASGTCWQELWDPDSDRPYYVNDRTGKVTWEKPEDIMEESEPPLEVNDDTNVRNPVEPQPEEDERPEVTDHDDTMSTGDYEVESALADGWLKAFDESTNKVYFYNQVSGEVSWDVPTQTEIEEDAPLDQETSQGSDVDLIDAAGTDCPESVQEASESEKGFSETNALDSPNAWVEMEDPSTRETYFYNTISGETSWEKTNFEGKSTDIPEKNEDLHPDFVTVDGEKSNVGTYQDDDLPDGWMVDKDPTSGKHFYYHSLTEEVTWERPVNEKDPPSTATNSLPSEAEPSGSEVENDSDEESLDISVADTETEAEEEDQETDIIEDQTVAVDKVVDGLTELPEGWEMVTVPDSDEVYYYNALTNETSWEKPTHDNSTPDEGIQDDLVDLYDAVRDSNTQAEIGLTLPLPVGWVESIDESSGKPFYWNEKTDETTWDRPITPEDMDDDKPNLPQNSECVEMNEIQNEGEAERVNVLPPDWIEVVDENSGEKYFYNTVTEETSWEFPEGNDAVERTTNLPDEDGSIRSELLDAVEVNREKFGIRGPLIRSQHSDVLAFLEHKTSSSDLLWQLIVIAAKSQGRLRSEEGIADRSSPEAAIVELLLCDDKSIETAVKTEKNSMTSNTKRPRTADAAARIQRLLLRGDKVGAIDEAMSAGDFATALLVSSRCDETTFAGVARKFAEDSFYSSSPMYTAALLFSGAWQAPSGGSTHNWGVEPSELKQTWRSHLAAIISNRTPGFGSIILSLGDRLSEIGEVKEAHFCYMVCGCTVENATDANARLSLLGCDHKVDSNVVLSTPEALESYERTEAFEWAKRQGNKNASLVSFQPFKLIYTMRLVDSGMEKLASLLINSVRLPHNIVPMGDATGRAIGLNQIFNDETAFHLIVTEVKGRIDREAAPPNGYGDAFLNGGMLKIEHATFAGSSVQAANQRNVATHIPAQNEYQQAASTDKSDLDASYLSAKSNLMDITGYSLDSPDFHKNMHKKIDMHSLPPLQEGSTEVAPERNGPERPVLQPLSQPPVPMSSGADFSEDNRPLMVVPPSAAAGPNETQPAVGMATPQQTRKPKSPPATAPSRLGEESAKKSKTATTPAPSSANSFSSLKSWLVKKMNPDAVQVHLPDSEGEMYFDKEKKRWILPGQDPDEEIKALGEPPKTPSASSDPAPQDDGPKDPLTMMMAPPSRVPSAMKRSGGMTKATPGRYPTGMMMPPTSSTMNNTSASKNQNDSAPLSASAPPPFAVFTPKPSRDEK